MSLMESFFFSGIATIHSGIYNLGGYFKPFPLFALRPYSAAKLLLELRGAVSRLGHLEIQVASMHEGLHPVCPTVRLLWKALSGLRAPWLITASLDKGQASS